MAHMLRAAQALAESLPDDYSEYYKVACLFTLPWLHQSEVTIFYDPDYYLRFFGESHALSPRSLANEFGLVLPAGFVEHGSIIDMEESGQEEWWCIGQPI